MHEQSSQFTPARNALCDPRVVVYAIGAVDRRIFGLHRHLNCQQTEKRSLRAENEITSDGLVLWKF